MYKNQLQELAQRSCFNLPSYSCIREGPDHAPRFKATVSFNGEVFESPGYHTTLRQAEHAAAEVALSTLSRRGPTQSLAARILDETGVCKNLLQETAQRAGVSLPVYTTIRSGPKHLPLFNCMVEVGGRNFVGEPAKTKKQAEKNAALAAWSALKHLTPASHMPLLLESSEADSRTNMSFQHGRDDRGSIQNSSAQGRTRVRSVNVRDRNHGSRDGSASAGQFYPPTLASTSSAGTDAVGYDKYHPVYASNPPSVTPSGEFSYDTAQRYLYNQSSLTGPTWPQREVGPETFAHGQTGRTFYNPRATPGSYGGSSRRQSGCHQRRHSLSGVESPALSREAMAMSRASGGGNMLGRVTPHPQQIRGLPYQSLSERFDLNRPSLLEELQLRDDEDDWSQKEGIPSSAHPHRHPARRTPWQSQSERFEFKNHLLPQVEEVHSRDEEEWLYGESYGSSSNVDREKGVEPTSGYKEGWLRGETLMQSLEEQKNCGYREGWLREEILKHSLEQKRQGYREGWPSNEVVNYRLEEASCPSQNHIRSQSHSNNHAYKDGRLHGLEKDRSHGYGNNYKDLQGENKSLYAATGMAASSSTASPSSSPFSSLWSKSTQWWGSRMPGSPSSAAAVIASTLGLRPASSMAPAVRVRQMVPVCSAPPPRRTDAPVPSHLPSTDSSLSMVDDEANVRQVFNSLKL
eukprot:c10668_g1_i1 orf=219-2285(+)